MITTTPSISQISAPRAWWWRHPEIPTVGLVAAAWLTLGVDHWRDHVTLGEQWRFGIGSWALMTSAMMLPGALAAIRRVSFTSIWRRRHRSAAIFTAAYLGVWIGVGAAAAISAALFEAVTGRSFLPGRFVVVAALGLAAGWQLTPAKRRFLHRCHLQRPISPRGWRGDKSLISFGLFHGRACVGSCGPIMAAMFLGAHDFHLMVPLAALTTAERYQRRPSMIAGAAGILTVALISVIAPG